MTATAQPQTTPASKTMALFEQQNRRIEDLNKRRNAVQVQLESARQQYEQAVSDAKAAYGTADLDELRAQLRAAEEANASAVAEFITALDTYEALVTRMERALSDPEALNEMLLELGRKSADTAAPVIAASPAPAMAAAFHDSMDI